MTLRRLHLLRHAPTAWNAEGRLQGRSDIGLSGVARAALRPLAHDHPLRRHRLVSSPLARAVETAERLFGRAPEIEPRLIETSWGAWEGLRLSDLRAADPEGMARAEAMGVDLRAPGGESPREVRERIAGWVGDLAPDDRGVVAIAHKGVIRAAVSLATGWSYEGRFPVALDWRRSISFRLDARGHLSVEGEQVPVTE